jgi:hypothetical protein
MHVNDFTAVWLDVPVVPLFMFMPEKAVKLVLEWHASQAIPAAGTWVDADGAVGDPPAANGIILG